MKYEIEVCVKEKDTTTYGHVWFGKKREWENISNCRKS